MINTFAGAFDSWTSLGRYLSALAPEIVALATTTSTPNTAGSNRVVVDMTQILLAVRIRGALGASLLRRRAPQLQPRCTRPGWARPIAAVED